MQKQLAILMIEEDIYIERDPVSALLMHILGSLKGHLLSRGHLLLRSTCYNFLFSALAKFKSILKWY